MKRNFALGSTENTLFVVLLAILNFGVIIWCTLLNHVPKLVIGCIALLSGYIIFNCIAAIIISERTQEK